MAIPADNELWCKLQEDAGGDTVASEVGPDGAELHGGETYGAGKFDNGVIIDANGEAVEFTDPGLDFFGSQGTVRLWVHPTGWTITNGVASGTDVHYLWNSDADVSNRQYTYWNNVDFRWAIMAATVWQTPYSFTPADMDSGDGEDHALALIWDTGAGLGDSKTRIIAWDGAEVASTTSALILPDMTGQTWRLGLSVGGVQPFIGVLDNIQVFSTGRPDQSDYDVEGFPDAPARIQTTNRGYW